jgi:hypothetical protein
MLWSKLHMSMFSTKEILGALTVLIILYNADCFFLGYYKHF